MSANCNAGRASFFGADVSTEFEPYFAILDLLSASERLSEARSSSDNFWRFWHPFRSWKGRVEAARFGPEKRASPHGRRLTPVSDAIMMNRLPLQDWAPWMCNVYQAGPRCKLHSAPSFNGRTADSGSAYRGSNPWGAARQIFILDSTLVQDSSFAGVIGG